MLRLNDGTIFRPAGLPKRGIEVAISVLFSFAKFRYGFILVIIPEQIRPYDVLYGFYTATADKSLKNSDM